MKELTIEEKAKAYDKAIERAKRRYYAPNAEKMLTYANRIIKEIFPELKESEDEKIRKEILEFVTIVADSKSNKMEWIAWLEKQGEKKTAVTDFNAKDWYVSKVDGKIHDMTYNPADKVEPKFNIGDTIIDKDLDEYGYGIIKDIKDGQYIFTDGSGINIDEQEGWQLIKTPTNIEQKPTEWSEEDEEIVEAINEYIKNLDIIFFEIKIGNTDILSREFREKVQHWLKSIKDSMVKED